MMTKWKVLAKQRPEAGLGSPVKRSSFSSGYTHLRVKESNYCMVIDNGQT